LSWISGLYLPGMWPNVAICHAPLSAQRMGDLELNFDISMGYCTSGLPGDYSNLNIRMGKQMEGDSESNESHGSM